MTRTRPRRGLTHGGGPGIGGFSTGTIVLFGIFLTTITRREGGDESLPLLLWGRSSPCDLRYAGKGRKEPVGEGYLPVNSSTLCSNFSFVGK